MIFLVWFCFVLFSVSGSGSVWRRRQSAMHLDRNDWKTKANARRRWELPERADTVGRQTWRYALLSLNLSLTVTHRRPYSEFGHHALDIDHRPYNRLIRISQSHAFRDRASRCDINTNGTHSHDTQRCAIPPPSNHKQTNSNLLLNVLFRLANYDIRMEVG